MKLEIGWPLLVLWALSMTYLLVDHFVRRRKTMIWKGLFERVSYPFEIVCPDGLVRHFAYMNEGDAEADARHASERGCQFYEKKSSLEEQHGDCPGGVHSVRRKDAA